MIMPLLEMAKVQQWSTDDHPCFLLTLCSMIEHLSPNIAATRPNDDLRIVNAFTRKAPSGFKNRADQ